MVSVPRATVTGSVRSRRAQPRSAPTIMALRRHRSAAAPANSPNSRYGVASRPTTAAVSPGEAVCWYASSGSATALAAVPATDADRDRYQSRKSRLANSSDRAATVTDTVFTDSAPHRYRFEAAQLKLVNHGE